jgi:hypothetical protein
MRFIIIVFFTFLSIVVTNAALLAQESTPANGSDFRIGIGVSLDLNSASESQVTPANNSNANGEVLGIPFLYPAIPLTFSIPMRFSHFKIEPEIGVYNYSYTLNGSKDSTGAINGETDNFSATSIRIGVGLYYTQQIAGNLSASIGPRVGIITNSSELDITPPPAETQFDKPSTTSTSRTDFFVGLTVGGEYFFSSAFSLGADAGFEYVSLGNQTTTVTPAVSGTPETTTGHSFETKEAIVARVYF